MYQAVQVLQVLTVQDLRHIFTDSMVYLCQDHHLHRHMVVNQFHLQVHSRVILYVIQDMLHYILVVDRLFMLLIRVKL